MLCRCDFDWYAVVLDGCAMGGRPGLHGADLFQMPFECPIDVILNPQALYNSKLSYRQERWLASPRLPAAVRNDREGVLVIDQRDEEALTLRARMVRSLDILGCPHRAVGRAVMRGMLRDGAALHWLALFTGALPASLVLGPRRHPQDCGSLSQW